MKASDYQEVKTDGPKFFSMDWGGLVALGYDDEKTPKYQALGLIDEFYIFPCVLTTDDIAKIKDFCGEYGKKTQLNVHQFLFLNEVKMKEPDFVCAVV